MPIVNLDYDLEDVSSSNDPVPAGMYAARIKECELGESSTKKPMLTFIWEIVEGEHQGRQIWDNVVLSVTWKVKQYAELAGLESGAQLNTEDFVGIEATIETKLEEYNDQMRANIKKIIP